MTRLPPISSGIIVVHSGHVPERITPVLVSTQVAKGVSPMRARRLVRLRVKNRTFIGFAPIAQSDFYVVNKKTRLWSVKEELPRELFSCDVGSLVVHDLVIQEERGVFHVALSPQDLQAIGKITQ